MRGPAPLSLQAPADGGAWRRAWLALHLSAAAALLAWAPGAISAWAALGLLALGLRSWRRMAPAAGPALAWDGQAWRVGERAVQVRLALDLGGWMLLRLDGEDRARDWLPLSPARAGALWPALRAALYATALPRPEAPAAPAGGA